MQQLKDKTALITGSVQGIGLAIAKELAVMGAKIAVHGLADKETGMNICGELKNLGAKDAQFFSANLLSPKEITNMVHSVQDWGGVDILVNNAGIQYVSPIKDMPDDKWNEIISVNLSAAFYTMKATLPNMEKKGYGRVINIASVHGLVASKDKTPYVSSKFGLIGLSKTVALEYAALGNRELGGITVNCICPGWVETNLIEAQINERTAVHGGERSLGIVDLLKEKQPSLRTSNAEEIGSLVVWLCQPIAHNLTGAAIPIDGGWTAR